MYLTTFKQNGKRYLRLMEAVYDEKAKVWRKKTVKSFGNIDKFMAEHPEEYQALREKYSTREKTRAEQQEGLKRLMTQTPEDHPVLTGTRGLLTLNLSYLMLRRLWDDDLGLGALFSELQECSHPGADLDISAVTLMLSMLKLTDPVASRFALSAADSYLGNPLDGKGVTALYRCLRFVGENKDAILSHVRGRLSLMFGCKYKVLLCSRTNSGLEFSPDQHRHNKSPKWSVALLTDENAIPVGFEVISDRAADREIEEAFAKLKAGWPAGSVIVAAESSPDWDAAANELNAAGISDFLYSRMSSIEDHFAVSACCCAVRPLPLGNRKCVEGHIAVCVLSLMLRRIIEMRLESSSVPQLPWDAVLECFKEANVLVYPGRTGINYLRMSPYENWEDPLTGKDWCLPDCADELNKILGNREYNAMSTPEEVGEVYGQREVRLTEWQEKCVLERSNQ